MSTTKFATQALHEGYNPLETSTASQSVPIHQTTSYVFKDAAQAAARFNLSESGFIYTRLNNPTNDVLEKRIAALENGIGAVVTASGTSATVTALLTLLKSGDHIVASSSLYGGTYVLLNVTLRRLGIHTTFVDPDDPENFTKAAQSNTKAVFVESLGNPKLDIIDLEAVAVQAKKLKVPFIVDNTVATPYLLRPIDHGANIVIHSLTKYISGNGTSLGGAIIDAGNFDWGNGNFPEFTEPSAGYHGLKLFEVLGSSAFIAKVRIEGLRDLGASLSPFSAFQIIQGLETLPIRLKKHSENALELAEFLENHPAVAWVNYPGLKSSKYHELAKKYLPNGQSGLLTFGLKSGFEGAKKLVGNTKLFSLLANLGDSKSLIIHPSSTTHQQLTEEQQLSAGVSLDLIRVSVGLEDIEDLKNDLEEAFNL